MPWGSKRRRGDREAALLADAVLARVDSSQRGAEAVRRALGRVELERPVRRLAIVAIGDPAHAEAVAGAIGDREVVVGAAGAVPLEGVDAAIAVAAEAAWDGDAVSELARVEELLLGVVVVAGPAAGVATGPEGEQGTDEALAALAELERVAGSSEHPPPPAPEKPAPSRAPPAGGRATIRKQELERRLTELTHREAALRRVSEVVERQRAELERRAQIDPGELQAANARAERAEERAAQLQAALERAEAAAAGTQAAIERAARAEGRLAELEAVAGRSEARVHELEPDRERAARAEGRVAELEALAERTETRLREQVAHAEQRIAELQDAVARLESERASVVESATARAVRAESRVAELEDAVARLEARAPKPEPEAAAEPGPAPPPAVSPFRRRNSLAALEELVREGQDRGLPEAEEWSFYLQQLRQHAAPDGTLPPQFDALVESVFGDRVSG